MKTVSIDPISDPLWLQLVHSTTSDLFHSPAWMQGVAQTYGFTFGAQLVLDGAGRPVAGIPYSHIDDLRGSRVVTLPFSDYCDPLVQSEEQWCTLVAAIGRADSPYTIRCLHNDLPLNDRRFCQSNRAKWHGLTLSPSLDLLWQNLHGSARRAIRKAERAAVQIHVAQTKADLRSFYLMHLGVRKQKYQMLAQPYQLFEQIWQNFMEQDRGLLLLAKQGDALLGATMLLEWQDKLYYKFNASLPTQLTVRPNDLMIWYAIQHAKARDLNFLDFGLSDWDQEGLVRYKRKYATTEKTISFLRRPAQGLCAEPPKVNQLLPQLTSLFTDQTVPDTITEAAGNMLYRYFA